MTDRETLWAWLENDNPAMDFDALEALRNVLEEDRGELRIVFDGPPGPVCGRFVEVENAEGRSVGAGKWRERGEYWELVLPDRCPPVVEPDLKDPDVGRAFNAICGLNTGLIFSKRARLAQIVVDFAREHATLEPRV